MEIRKNPRRSPSVLQPQKATQARQATDVHGSKAPSGQKESFRQLDAQLAFGGAQAPSSREQTLQQAIAAKGRRSAASRLSRAQASEKTSKAPSPLAEAQMMAEASEFLKSQGIELQGRHPEKQLKNLRKTFSKNDDLRRDFLHKMTQKDVDGGAMALESFSNTLQRARWLHSRVKNNGKIKIDGKDLGRDIGLLFAGTDQMMDGPKGRYDHRWNINEQNPGGKLPPTGFREGLLNDDGPATEDQTHHLAFYTMVGATKDNIFGSAIGYLGAWWSDRGNPQDIELGKRGVDLGRKLDDPDFNPHQWIWDKLGDPSRTN